VRDLLTVTETWTTDSPSLTHELPLCATPKSGEQTAAHNISPKANTTEGQHLRRLSGCRVRPELDRPDAIDISTPPITARTPTNGLKTAAAVSDRLRKT
jgi:hypothetical protein